MQIYASIQENPIGNLTYPTVTAMWAAPWESTQVPISQPTGIGQFILVSTCTKFVYKGKEAPWPHLLSLLPIL